MPVDPQIAALLELFDRSPMGQIAPESISGLTAVEVRARMAAVDRVESDGSTTDITAPHPDGHAIPIRLHDPGTASPGPIVIYLHGGGWVTGGNDIQFGTANSLARDTGLMVAAVDYRLAPEYPFPTGLEDCWHALGWLAANGDRIGGDGRRIALVGDSAGATLATVLTMMARDAGSPRIGCQTLIYPSTDSDPARWPSMRENSRGYGLVPELLAWFQSQYASADQRNDPQVAPIRARDLGNLPPALVITAQYDILRDEGEAYAEALRAAGNRVVSTRYDGQIHGFYALPDSFDNAVRCRKDVAEFIVRNI